MILIEVLRRKNQEIFRQHENGLVREVGEAEVAFDQYLDEHLVEEAIYEVREDGRLRFKCVAYVDAKKIKIE